MSAQTYILVAVSGRAVWVRVEGRGNLMNSTGLKQFAREMTNRGFREFIVDLKNCESMDSTFMGVLAGIALKLIEYGQGSLRTVNVNERCKSLLENLGLDNLFSVDQSAPKDSPDSHERLEVAPSDKETTARTALEAHVDVVRADPERNKSKFKDVIEFLRQDLQGDV